MRHMALPRTKGYQPTRKSDDIYSVEFHDTQMPSRIYNGLSIVVFLFTVTEAISASYRAWEVENMSVMCLQSTR